MRELDKAIINNDVKHIIFLLQQNVDCESAVLLHLKETLVPHYFTEEALRDRGAILSLDDLNAAIVKYSQISTSSEPIDTYRIDHYIKRLYLSSQQALKMWQTGKLVNQELENNWNLDAISYLGSKWIKGELPKVLQEYAEATEESYTDHKYQKWSGQNLESTEANHLDEVVLQALRTHWHMGGDDADIVSTQIRNNVIEEAVELCRSNTDVAFSKDVLTFIRGKVTEQIYSNDINKELIKNALEEEKSRILKDKIVVNHAPYYEQAMVNLFAKWQEGTLEPHVNDDVTAYIKKQFANYPLSGQLKSAFLEKAIPQVLDQYRNGELDGELMERLMLQFKANIVGYYEKDATKDTPYREELSQVIFTKMLESWKAQELNPEASHYLQTHLLSDLQKSLQEFGLPTSRFTLFLMVSRQQDELSFLRQEMASMRQELMELKGVKEVKDVAPAAEAKKADVSLAEAAQQQGMFKPAAPSTTTSTAEWSLLPKFGSK